jgi:hypothetical protein
MASEKRGVIVFVAKGQHEYPKAAKWNAPATGQLFVYAEGNELLAQFPAGGWNRVIHAGEEAAEDLSGLGLIH